MTALLPPDKLKKYADEILQHQNNNKITLRELKSILGKLQFATSVVMPGRAFLRRMYDLTKGINKPFHYVRLSKQVKQDLNMWYHFLKFYNGVTIIRKPDLSDSSYLHMYSDASKMGFGATYGSHWIQGKWPEVWKDKNIAFLELYPVYLLIYIFGNKILNSRIIFHCDNKAVVDILNATTSKDKDIMSIVRQLVLELLKHNIFLRAQHIPGVNNVLNDLISRYQVDTQVMQQFGMKPFKTAVPTHLLPENFIFH